MFMFSVEIILHSANKFSNNKKLLFRSGEQIHCICGCAILIASLGSTVNLLANTVMLHCIQPLRYKAFHIMTLNYFLIFTNFCYVLNAYDLDPEDIQILK